MPRIEQDISHALHTQAYQLCGGELDGKRVRVETYSYGQPAESLVFVRTFDLVLFYTFDGCAQSFVFGGYVVKPSSAERDPMSRLRDS
jgi:hypothetical protein